MTIHPLSILIFMGLTSLVPESDTSVVRDFVIACIAVLLGGGLRIARKIEMKQLDSKAQAFRLMFYALAVGLSANYALCHYYPSIPRPFIVGLVSLFSEVIISQLDNGAPAFVKAVGKAFTSFVVGYINKKDNNSEED